MFELHFSISTEASNGFNSSCLHLLMELLELSCVTLRGFVCFVYVATIFCEPSEPSEARSLGANFDLNLRFLVAPPVFNSDVSISTLDGRQVQPEQLVMNAH